MNIHRNAPMFGISLCLVLTLGVAAGCSGTDGDGEDLCEGPELLPDASPLNLGELYPPPEDGEGDPGDTARTPVERTLLLESTCQQTVEISTTCLVDEDGNPAEEETEHFFKEGPTQTSIPTDEESALRVTYERGSPNSGDDIDNVSVVVQSNAENFPTLIVPVCGRVVKEGSDRGPITCESPVEAPDEGEKQSGICGS